MTSTLPGPSSLRPAPAIEVGVTVAGLDPEELVAGHGSPLYVYDAQVIRRRVDVLRAAMPSTVDVAFATKANPSPGVLELLAGMGVGADVASGGELRAAMRAGFPARGIVFTGPGKTDAEIDAALRAGIGALTVESLDELDAVVEAASRAPAGQGLLLRLATRAASETRPIIGGAGNAKFGLSDDEADAAITRLRGQGLLAPGGPYVLRGFHAFGASNVRDAAVLVHGVEELARRAERIADRHGLTIELLDAGGGLGIPYGLAEPPLVLAAFAEGIRTELRKWSGRRALHGCRLLLEPGRWLTGPAGTYLCRVLRSKVRGGRHIAITDGGIHHLLRPRLVGQDHRVVPVGQAASRSPDAVLDVVGPLCTGLDILASGVAAASPRRGDLLAVLDAGAYGYSESMPFFLSHPIPAEVVVDGGAVRVSRERIEPL